MPEKDGGRQRQRSGRFFSRLRVRCLYIGESLRANERAERICTVAGGCLCAVLLIAVGLCAGLFKLPQPYAVTINDDGDARTVSTYSRTVGELLTQSGVTLSEHDMLDCATYTDITDGMTVGIDRAMRIDVTSGGQTGVYYLMDGTVADAVAAAGIVPDDMDEISPAMCEPLTDGMAVTHCRVYTEIAKETELVEYAKVRKENAKLAEGTTRTAVQGSMGLKEMTVEITYRDGMPIARDSLSEHVTVAPVDEIIEIGTMPEPTATPKPTKKPSASATAKPSPTATAESEPVAAASPGNTDGGDTGGRRTSVPTVSEIHSAVTLEEHRSAAPPAESIIAYRMTASDVTAYYTGSKTASGTTPKLGTISCYWPILPKGTKIYVPGYGYGVVEDQGGNTDPTNIDLDLFVLTREQAFDWWGRRRNVEFYVLTD